MTFTIIINGTTLFTDAVWNDDRIQVDQIRGAIEFLCNEMTAVSCTTVSGFEVIRNK